MGSFTKKIIELRFTLATGTFNSGEPTKIVKGLKCDITIDKPGIPAKNEAKGVVYGMSEQDVEALTTLSYRPLQLGRNLVEIWAGEEVSGVEQLTLAYRGDVSQAFGDYSNMPDVNFVFEAVTGMYSSVEPIPPFTGEGGQDVAAMLESMANQMQVSFTNNGVVATMENPYFKGTVYQQALKLAEAVGIDMVLDDDTMLISPKGEPLGQKELAPLLSKSTGLVGYPGFSSSGLTVKSLYNTSIRVGYFINVQSEIKRASGSFRVTSLKHEISSENPTGAWFTISEISYIANPLFTV